MFKAITTTVPNNPLTVAGDINGDGKADILQTSGDGATVSVLLGNGDGSFTTGTSLTPTGGVSHTALGDVNGDGKLDLAIANSAGTGVTVVLGNGNGTFQAQSNAFATGVTALALGDVNGDGRADLITSKGGDAIFVRLEQGNGTFGSAISTVPIAHNNGTATYSFAAVDLTGDGRADLYVLDRDFAVRFILAGNGDGSFQPSEPFRYISSGSAYTAPIIGDINGDGLADVFQAPVGATSYGGSNQINIALNGHSPAGLISVVPSEFNQDGHLVVNFATLADVNGDGRPDVIYNTNDGGAMGVLLNLPASTNTAATATLTVLSTYPSYGSLHYVGADADGIAALSAIVQRSNDTGGYDTISGPVTYDPFYLPSVIDNGHNIRFVETIADLNLNLSTATSREIHVAGSFLQQGTPVAIATTPLDDYFVGTLDTNGLSNIAVYADSVRDEIALIRLSPNNFYGHGPGVVEGNFSAIGAGGADTLYNIQQLRFLDGVLTVNANDPASVVTRLYEGALGRDPDSAGLSHFTGALEHGDGVAAVISALTASSEFQAHGGAAPSSSFVSALYQSVLHRTGDQEEVQYWADRIDAGTSRSDVIVAIAQSGEAIAFSSTALKTTSIFALDEHAAQVARLYDTAFGRDPDRAGLEVWRGFLDQGGAGHTLGDVANAFAGSPEFAARYGQAGTDAYVTALYQNTLHRAPDDAGRAHWNAVLDGHSETRAQVALDFSESAEHQSLLAPHIQDGIHLI